MPVTADLGQQPYPMETGKKISKIDVVNVVIMRIATIRDRFVHSPFYVLFYLGFRMLESLVYLLFFLPTGKLLE